jgi:guanylate kinase
METMTIFCIISKIKSGKDSYLREVFKDSDFVKRYILKPFKYGTTRRGHLESNSQDYYTVSEEEARNIPQDELLEFRSYYTLTEGTVYYFTKYDDIIGKSGNYLCISSPYQYEQYKEWMEKENLKLGRERYRLFMIYIDCSINSRLQKIYNENYSEDDLCEICRRIIQDRNDFRSISKSLTELANCKNHEKVCYIENEYDFDQNLNYRANLFTIKRFIMDHGKCPL